MNRNIILLMYFIFLFTNPLAFCQPGLSISPATTSVEIGEEFELNVVTTDFTSMTNASFSLKWDPTILKLDSYDFLSLDNAQLFVNDLFVEDGKFSLIWNNAVTEKPSVEDGTSILKLMFTSLSMTKGETTIEFVNNPTVGNTITCITGTDIEHSLVVIENGMISVGSTSTTTSGLSTNTFELLPISPNPFKEQTLVPFVLHNSEYINFNIYNVDGKSIFQYSNKYGEGTHYIHLEKEDFDGPGVYFLQVETSKTLLNKKVILVR